MPLPRIRRVIQLVKLVNKPLADARGRPGDVQGVLDGELEAFITAYLMGKASGTLGQAVAEDDDAWTARRGDSQNPQWPGSGASTRRTASAGMTWTVIVLASSAASFLITCTWSPPASTKPMPTV